MILLLSITAKSGFCARSNVAPQKILQKTDTIPVGSDTANTRMQDYVTIQGAKVLIVKNNKGKPIDSDITMRDGSVVRKDGTLITKDGKTYLLHEGDKVYISGILEAPKIQ